MKNKKIIIISLIAFLLTSIICIKSYAIGWADMEDENTNQNITKQKTNQEDTPYDYTLSSNNYLKSLSVEGYKLTPTFDKQTVDYEIKEEIKVDTITINAEPEDERAQVVGVGKVNISSNQNEIKIDVIAESGTYKSYFIKLNRPTTANVANENVIENVENINNIDSNTIGEKKEVSLKTIISIVIVVLILGLIFAAVSKTGNSKGKRKRR